MPKSAVVRRDYTKLIQRFESEGQRQIERIKQKKQAFAEEIIQFAVMVQDWRDQAVQLDDGEEGACYRTVDRWFKKWSAENLGDKYQVYHWNTIAKAAAVLSSPKVLPHLPNTKMALFHLAKSTKGDKSADLQRLKTWIDKGVLSADTTVAAAKRLGGTSSSRDKKVSTKSHSTSAGKKQVLANIEKEALALSVTVNSLPVQNRDKPTFNDRGLAIALLRSEFDNESGMEVVKVLTVLNDETILSHALSALK
jgi:hypothetical protein